MTDFSESEEDLSSDDPEQEGDLALLSRSLNALLIRIYKEAFPYLTNNKTESRDLRKCSGEG